MSSPIFKEERHEIILSLIKKFNKVTVNDLVSKFNVSAETIRRDLNELEKQGELERTYGGAIGVSHNPREFEAILMDRLIKNANEKKRIAQYATSIIKPGETIYLSPGSTSYYLAENIINTFELTVITNSLVIANLLAESKVVSVIVLGGFLKKTEMSLGYIFNEDVLSSIQINKVFLGCQGIHAQAGITNIQFDGIGTDSSVARVNKEVIVLADSTKIGVVGKNLIAPIDYVGAIITTKNAPKIEIKALKDQGVSVVQV